jgi:transcriptional regulator with XRE-family HTH domain
MPGDVLWTLWTAPPARALAARRLPGALIRLGREHRAWTLAELGGRLGCSASTLSRLERSTRVVDLTLVQRAAVEVGVPAHLLVASLAPPDPPARGAARVAAPRSPAAEESSMRRRSLFAVAAAGPASLILGLDEALAQTPPATVRAALLDQRLSGARDLYDGGDHGRLLGALPGLIADAHAAAGSRRDLDQARLSTVYSLACALLVKTGHHGRARLTADRARTWAEVSGSPLAQAAAAREMAIVLRHQEQNAAASRLMASATAALEATGLRTGAQAAAYAQMLCTMAYTAARAGQRADALAMTEEARRAGRRLPAAAPAGRLFPLSPAAVDLYAVGVHWALGDAGAALEAGRSLRPEQFPTAERRARMHTDLARAWWQWDRPEQTARELLAALRASPAEVRDRPAIHAVARALSTRHPRVQGVRELAAAAGLSANG